MRNLYKAAILILPFFSAHAEEGGLGLKVYPTERDGSAQIQVSYLNQGSEPSVVLVFEIMAAAFSSSGVGEAPPLLEIVDMRTGAVVTRQASGYEHHIMPNSVLTFSMVMSQKEEVSLFSKHIREMAISFIDSKGAKVGYLSLADVCERSPDNVVDASTGRVGCAKN